MNYIQAVGRGNIYKWHGLAESSEGNEWLVFATALCGKTVIRPVSSFIFVPHARGNCLTCSRIVLRKKDASVPAGRLSAEDEVDVQASLARQDARYRK